MLIKIKNKKQNKFIVSEKLYIGITDTIIVLDLLWHVVRGDDKQQERTADDEGSNKEGKGGKGDGDGDKGGR